MGATADADLDHVTAVAGAVRGLDPLDAEARECGTTAEEVVETAAEEEGETTNLGDAPEKPRVPMYLSSSVLENSRIFKDFLRGTYY